MSIKPCLLKGLEEKFTIANKNAFYLVQIVCPVFKFPKIRQEKILLNFDYFQCQHDINMKMDDFLQKLKKVVGIVLYGLAISIQIAGKLVRISCYIIIQTTNLFLANFWSQLLPYFKEISDAHQHFYEVKQCLKLKNNWIQKWIV